MNSLQAVADHAMEHEIGWPTDVGTMVAAADPPPFNKAIGPVKARGPASGVVLYRGDTVLEWGQPDRVDMTFSATKSYLSTCVGLALDRGLIRSVHDPVHSYVEGRWFTGDHNRQITWHHLLQQTSEWSGTLFGIPDSVDHNRSVARGESNTGKKGQARSLHNPGSYWEYNDVRVNLLGYAALHVWRESLPDVLKREIMDPIGATDTWEWHPYDNAWVEIDGRSLPSVPGGAHWGGGLWISARDHARFGQLWLNQGRWNDVQLISETWVGASLTNSQANAQYGYMWWLNPGRVAWKNASEDAFSAQGAGGNVVCVVPEHKLVVVTRWAADPAQIVCMTIDALKDMT